MPLFALFAGKIVGPTALIASVSAGVGMFTGDGIATAITVIGLASLYVFSKAIPVIAEGIVKITSAAAEGKAKWRAADAKAESALIKTRENLATIEDVRREAAAEIAKVREEAAAMVAAANIKVEEAEKAERDRRHEMAKKINGQLLTTKADVMELKDKIGMVDKSHAGAINTVGDSLQHVADQMHPPVPVDVPHLDPINGGGKESNP